MEDLGWFLNVFKIWNPVPVHRGHDSKYIYDCRFVGPIGATLVPHLFPVMVFF